MNKLSDKRLEMLDKAISIYDCMRESDDDVIIKMSKELFVELIAVNHPFVTYSRDLFHPHKYKGKYLELVPTFDYVAVAYFNTRTCIIHHLKEIKEGENNAI